MIQLITTEIELSQDEIKEAITDWLYNKDIINSEMDIELRASTSDVSPMFTIVTAKITFTKN